MMIMPKCPECGEEIESLIGYERIERKNGTEWRYEA
jgi:hypothetical protein